MNGSLHAAAQVDIFLRSEISKEYDLTYREVFTLMAIAQRIGNAEESWPSLNYLSSYTRLPKTAIQRSIKSLVNKSLLIKKSTQMNNHYSISLPNLDYSHPDHSLEKTMVTPTATMVTGTIPMVTPTIDYGHPDHHIESKENQERINKRESGKKRRSSLPEFFEPTQKQREDCASKEIDCAHEELRFKSDARAKGKTFYDWHAAFDLWLDNARPVVNVVGETFRPPPTQTNRNETRCTLQFFDQKTKIQDNGKFEELDPVMQERMKSLIGGSH